MTIVLYCIVLYCILNPTDIRAYYPDSFWFGVLFSGVASGQSGQLPLYRTGQRQNYCWISSSCCWT